MDVRVEKIPNIVVHHQVKKKRQRVDIAKVQERGVLKRLVTIASSHRILTSHMDSDRDYRSQFPEGSDPAPTFQPPTQESVSDISVPVR